MDLELFSLYCETRIITFGPICQFCYCTFTLRALSLVGNQPVRLYKLGIQVGRAFWSLEALKGVQSISFKEIYPCQPACGIETSPSRRPRAVCMNALR